MQTINLGEGQIKSLKEILSLENPKKILLLHGKSSYKIFSDKIEEQIDFNYTRYSISDSKISFEMIAETLWTE